MFYIFKSMNIQNLEIVTEHANLCRLMSHPGRLAVAQFICHGEKSVGEIAEHFGASISTISQYLRIFKDTNMVTVRKVGHTVYYSIRHEKLIQACHLIREVVVENMIERGKIAENTTEQEMYNGNK